jgi:integrase
MRVPICFADLQDGRGFKRLAKKLQQKSPNSLPLSLSSAQQILARGLGYHDLHDLQQSSTNEIPPGSSLNQAEARDSINTAVFVFWKSHSATAIDSRQLDDLVKHLPLQELSVFRTGAVQASGECSNPGADADDAKQLHAEPTNDLPSREEPHFNVAELARTWEAVQSAGVLRDQCLFALLLTGRRVNEIRDSRVCDFSEKDGVTSFRFERTKSTNQYAHAHVPSVFVNIVMNHVLKSNLSQDDYLFHSPRDPSKPMSEFMMRKVITSYFQAAGVAFKSPHELRPAVVVNFLKFNLTEISQQMGHSSLSTTLYYISPPKKAKK